MYPRPRNRERAWPHQWEEPPSHSLLAVVGPRVRGGYKQKPTGYNSFPTSLSPWERFLGPKSKLEQMVPSLRLLSQLGNRGDAPGAMAVHLPPLVGITAGYPEGTGAPNYAKVLEGGFLAPPSGTLAYVRLA